MFLAALLLILSATADPAADPDPTPDPAPVASAIPTATPAAAATPDAVLFEAPPIDPRLLDPNTPVVRPEGALIGTSAARRGTPSLVSIIAVPAGCVVVGGATYAGLAAHTGDLGGPAIEMGAGWAGGVSGAMAAWLAVYLVHPSSFTRQPDKVLDGSLAPTLAVLAAAPVAAGGATFLAAEWVEGRAPHREEVLFSAMAGAAIGEGIWFVSSRLLHTPGAAGPVTLAFVPIGAGAAIGARLARGHYGREKPLLRTPVMLVVRF